ncbi:hypothetical protein STSP2_01636 [Anaerohalosphaera lusitana]|uniref:Carbohydrate-binding module family 96 domain-containing protein n=2 Tax=Anaerohalosphaera lusitana TaxID=1936003 RepID=A0A1U9NKK7_9BACT|nr:hypothetical protein STSP2_01636 [Anaerohalosphaera lusitana]
MKAKRKFYKGCFALLAVLACMQLAAGIAVGGVVETDADTYCEGDGDNHGDKGFITVKRSTAGAGSAWTRTGWMHFDLSGEGICSTASLTVTVDAADVGSGTLTIWGIKDGQPGDEYGTDWEEMTITGDNAPQTPDFAEDAHTTKLGEYSWTSTPAVGEQIVFSTEALANFLNADTNDEVTILIVRNPNNANLNIESRESGEGTPTLELSLEPVAWGYSPANDSFDVPVDTTLTWQTGRDLTDPTQPNADVDYHNVYVGPASEPNGLLDVIPVQVDNDGSGTGSYTVTGLDYATEYVWRVDEVMNDSTVWEGPTSSFTTEVPPQLLAHYTFDGTVADSSGNGFDGTYTDTANDPNYVAGLDNLGQAIELWAAGPYIEVPTTAFDNMGPREISIAFWYYGDSTQPLGDHAFEGRANGNRVMSVHLPWSNGNAYWDAGNSSGTPDRIYKTMDASEYKEQWNHAVFIKDVTAGTMSIWLNGQKWHEGTGLTKALEAPDMFWIGSGDSTTYTGYMDDFRIYNYALTDLEIATLYTTGSGESICFESNPMDFDGDCIVEIDDLVEFMSGWLECGLAPDCQ